MIALAPEVDRDVLERTSDLFDRVRERIGYDEWNTLVGQSCGDPVQEFRDLMNAIRGGTLDDLWRENPRLVIAKVAKVLAAALCRAADLLGGADPPVFGASLATDVDLREAGRSLALRLDPVAHATTGSPRAGLLEFPFIVRLGLPFLLELFQRLGEQFLKGGD